MDNDKYKYTVDAIADVLKFAWVNRRGNKNIYVIRCWYLITIALIGVYAWAFYADSNGNWTIGISTATLGWTEVVFFLIATLAALAFLYFMNRKEYAKQSDIDLIKETSNKILSNTHKLLNIMENNGSSVIKHLMPDLRCAIEQLKVKSAYQYLTTIKNEVEIHFKKDYVLQATTYYYLGQCAKFIPGKDSKKHFSDAYRLMKKSGDMEPEILEAMVYVACIEKKYDVAQNYANELLTITPDSCWTVIPRLISSNKLCDACKELPENIDREMAVSNLLMMGGGGDYDLGVDIETYSLKQLIGLTSENFPLWILNLSVALTRFFQTFAITKNVGAMYSKNAKALHDISDTYLKELQKTEMENLLPDTVCMHALTGFFKDQNTKWIDIMKTASYTANMKEIYHLGYAIMLCATNRDNEATALLKNYGDDAPSSILSMRLQIVALKIDVAEMKNIFKCASESQCAIPDHLLNMFLGVTRMLHEQMEGYLDNLNIENPLMKQAYAEYLKYLRNDDVDVDWLSSVEQQFSPIFLPYLSCIYKDKIDLKRGVETLKKCVDRKVLDLRSRLLVDFMMEDQSYRSELYHLLKDLRQAVEDIHEYDVQLMNMELQMSEEILDFQNCREITTQMKILIPNNESLLVHHILALNGCGGYNEEIKSYQPNFLKATLSNEEVKNTVNVYQSINEAAFALDLLYQNIKKTNDQNLKDFYVNRHLHPDFSDLISNEKKTVELYDFVTLKICDEIKNIEVTPGSIYEDLVDKQKENVCQIDIKGSKSIEILEIHNKYHKLLKDVFDELQNNNGSKNIKMFSSADFDFENNPLGALMKMAGRTEEVREREKEAVRNYRRGETPLMSFIKNNGIMADLYEKIFGDFALCTFHNEFIDSYFRNKLDVNQLKVVLDMSSLIMLHEYDKKFGLEYDKKFYVSRGLVNLIEMEFLNEEKGSLTFFSQEIQDKITLTISEDRKSGLWNKLKMLSEWIENRCEVLVAEEKLNYKFDDVQSVPTIIEMESVMLAMRGYLLLTEDWSYTKKFLYLFPSMSVYNWLSLTGKSYVEEYGQMMLEMGNLGYPMKADYIVEQYLLFANSTKNNYNTCLLNIEKYPVSWEQVLEAGKKLLTGIITPAKMAGVTNLFVMMLNVLDQKTSKLLIYRELMTNHDQTYRQCLLDALKISHPILLSV